MTWSYSFEYKGQHHRLQPGTVIVGRSRTCDVTISEPSVSRQHLRVAVENGTVVIYDLGSSNGTSINGKAVHGQAEIQDGDRLGLGDAEILVHVQAPVAPEVPAEPAPPRKPPGDATTMLQRQSVALAVEVEGTEPPTSESEAPLDVRAMAQGAPAAEAPDDGASAPSPPATFATMPLETSQFHDVALAPPPAPSPPAPSPPPPPTAPPPTASPDAFRPGPTAPPPPAQASGEMLSSLEGFDDTMFGPPSESKGEDPAREERTAELSVGTYQTKRPTGLLGRILGLFRRG